MSVDEELFSSSGNNKPKPGQEGLRGLISGNKQNKIKQSKKTFFYQISESHKSKCNLSNSGLTPVTFRVSRKEKGAIDGTQWALCCWCC